MRVPGRGTALVALTLGVVGLGSCISLIVFFVVGGPFGLVNDLGNGLLGVLSAVLAVTSWRLGAEPGPGRGAVGVGLATAGATATVVGSALVVSEATGFFLAGLVSSSGFALVGIWLVLLNRWVAAHGGGRWPSRRTGLGVVAGAVMMLGLVSVPGIVMGLDDMETAPAWVHVGGVGWSGTYLLLPVWSIWLGRALAPRSDTAGSAVVRSRPS